VSVIKQGFQGTLQIGGKEVSIPSTRAFDLIDVELPRAIEQPEFNAERKIQHLGAAARYRFDKA